MGRLRSPHAAHSSAIIILFVALAGCDTGDRPAAPLPPRSGTGSGRVEPEGCINDVLEAYARYGEEGALDLYAGALHPDYLWHFQPGDVRPGGSPCLDRDEDVAVTGKIFERATLLHLDISAGKWNELCRYNGAPCEGCFETARKYRIMAQFGENGKIHMGREVIVIVVAPDPGIAGRFAILAMHDVDDD
jgi:hypothetical protein